MDARADEMLFRRHGRVAIVTFNRPDVLNAFKASTYERLLEVIAEVAADEGTRALVLTGAGRAFSSGTDLRELADAALVAVERNQEITRRIVGLPQVTIAAVNGVAAGFGAELAVACDIRIAARSARFLFPEVRRGLYLTNGVTWLLPRIVGLGAAMDWLTTGRDVAAEEAHARGLVSRVVPDGSAAEAALELGEVIASNAPIPVRMIKRALYDDAPDLESALAAEIEAVVRCQETRDWEEGVRSFLEKREPEYEGR